MSARPWRPWAAAGDIVQCRFPEGKAGIPGPKDRPALVLEVEEDPENSEDCIVRVAYGTSQGISRRFPGEFTVASNDPSAGLDRDTKFDLGNSVRLRFDDDWFAAAPARRPKHPKRGALDIRNPKIKRALQAAIIEARAAGRL